jgi:hypothetical protein
MALDSHDVSRFLTELPPADVGLVLVFIAIYGILPLLLYGLGRALRYVLSGE